MRAILLFALFTTSLVVPCLSQTKKGGKSSAVKPYVIGVIEEIPSKQLGENRTLNIYLPEGYNAKDTVTYPVIYLLDGSADEDFLHVVGLVQFNTFPWINQLPKSIVVGIANIDRRRDFTYPTTVAADQGRYKTAGQSAKFISFLETELQPFIDRHYKTTKSKTVIGQSLGGLLVTEVLFMKPTLFNKYIIISPSIWWDNGSLLAQTSVALQESFNQKTEVYIGVGKEGLTPSDTPRVMEVDANLLYEKLRGAKNNQLTVYFDYLPQEDHATITHQAVFNAFRLLYPLPAKK
ncbi:esterase [Rufibacter sp. DG15C]|uniref:alpha/beta hydrolase n=1 Tax=Rufibacter sp. DG15C TaxID=1379909 RepID=UPI00078C6CAE|nr:alpha/beta hydrolase-fold protein [Rufibacter sp. DG15C]AMM50786.1 esterase [Rufibacter sp. DG15C]